MSFRSTCIGVGLAATCSLSLGGQAPPIRGLDHVPLAVANLDAAADRFRALGFTLKPGRPHDNGIANVHAKFPDGTEIELITAPEARDDLTSYYRRHLAKGDGPAFVAFFAPDRTDAVRRINADLPDYMFLGPRNASPTDRPEHFQHPNGADALVSVWLAGADLTPERRLLERMGATMTDEVREVPDQIRVTVARFAEGDVLLLPAGRALVPGRRIVGVTVRVSGIAGAERVRIGGVAPTVVRRPAGASVFWPPTVAHGMWLELRASR